MNAQDLIKQLSLSVGKVIKKLYPNIVVDIKLNIPTDKSKANLVITESFKIGTIVKKTPIQIANEICEAFNHSGELTPYFILESCAPGFINITFKNSYLDILMKDIYELKNEYGKNDSLKGQTWVIEHTSPNPNKAMHLGHLRNNLTGMAISKICEFNGATVICDAVDNNRGIAIAKAMWGYIVCMNKDKKRITDINYWYEHQSEWFEPNDIHEKGDNFVGECYLNGSEEFKKNPDTEKLIRDLVVKWENNNDIVRALWEKVLSFAHNGIQETLDRLGNRWDYVWHESDHYQKGKDIVELGLKKKVFKKLKDGAILTNLKKYSITDTIVIKSDGTSLYITQDLALTKLKKEKYNANKLIWVIGSEQSLAMKQMFAVCEQLGIGKLSDFDHVSYGMVNVQTDTGQIKKMSSRGGEVILIDELINEIKDGLDKSNRDYDGKDSEQIAIAVVKLALLKPSRLSNIVINTKKVITLEGDSAIYLLYTYARMKSLLSKSPVNINENFEFTQNESELVSRLQYFPNIVANSLLDYTPNFIVEFLFELAHMFNSMYTGEKFITDDDKETNKKMLMTQNILTIFNNAFQILGINPPSKI